MQKITNLAALLAAAALAAAAPAASALSSALGGGNQVVNVQTTAPDGTSAARGALKLVSGTPPSVDNSNLARAYAHDCSGCSSVAVAIEAVVVTGSPETVAPNNVALAFTERCTGCRVFAYAYQVVLKAERPVALSPDGKRQFGDLRGRVSDLAASGEPFAQLKTDLDAVVADLRTLLSEELVAKGKAKLGGASKRVDAD